MSALDIALDFATLVVLSGVAAMLLRATNRPPAATVSVDGLVDYMQQLAEKRYPDFEWAGITISRPGVPPVVLVVSPVNPPELARPVPDAF